MSELLKLAIVDPVGAKAGLDHYDRELASSLRKLNCSVDIYSNFSDDDNEFRVFPFRFWRNPFLIFTLMMIYRQVVRRCAANQIEAIICHLFHANKIDVWFLEKCKKAGIKTAVILHDVESHLSKEKNDQKLSECLSLAGSIFLHSEFSQKELSAKFGTRFDAKVTLVPHGHFLSLPTNISRQQAFKALKLDPNRKYVLFFGMIKPTKGLDVLINAMKEQNADLIIAGRLRKQSFAQFEQLLSENNMRDRVHRFIRYIGNDERDLFFKAADLIVLPYDKVYQSGVLLMAMSYGLPVIATDLEPFKEIIDQPNNALLFKRGDSFDLSVKIMESLLHPEHAEARAKLAFEQMRELHSWDLIAQKMKGVIE